MPEKHINTDYSAKRHPWYRHSGDPIGETYYKKKMGRNLNRAMMSADPEGNILPHQHSNFIPVRHALNFIAKMDVSEEGPRQLNSMQHMKGIV